MGNTINKGFCLLDESRRQLPQIILMFFLVSLLDLAGIGLIGPFLGILFNGLDFLPPQIKHSLPLEILTHQEILITIGVGMVFVYAIKNTVGIFVTRVIINFSQKQQVRIRERLIVYYQGMDYSALIKSNSSEYINKVQLMVPNYANLLMSVLQTLADIIVGLIIIIFLIWTDPYAFSFLAVIFISAVLVFDLFIRRRVANAGALSNTSSSKIVRYVNEALRGFKEIRILQQEKYFRDGVVDNSNAYANTQKIIFFYSTLPKYIFEMVIITFVVVISLYTFYNTNDPITMIPTLGVFGMASIRLLPLARNFSLTLNRIHFSRDTIHKLAEDLISKPPLTEVATSQTKTNLVFKDIKTIELKDIRYTYLNSTKPVLNHIAIKINAGEHIGIIGPSGAGKTTLIDIFLGLLKPSHGQLLVNGHDISDHPQALWDHVAYLPQETFIIDGTMRQNIALGCWPDQVDEKQLTQAIKRAQIEDLLDRLPNGVNTSLGERGVNISGGQRQRIALARAFYFNRKILILDEATSALDTDTETHITNYLKTLKNYVTVISITHRANSLQYCDRILRMSDGSLN